MCPTHKFKIIFHIRGSVLHSIIHKENPTRCNRVSKFFYFIFIWSLTCFGRHAAHRHIQQPSMYAKPEAVSAVLGSWWWAVYRPKLVELHINMKLKNLDTLLHLVGFSLWSMLWCTDPRTYSALVSAPWIYMYYLRALYLLLLPLNEWKASSVSTINRWWWRLWQWRQQVFRTPDSCSKLTQLVTQNHFVTFSHHEIQVLYKVSF